MIPVYDDSENVEKVRIFDHGVDSQEPEDFGESQLSRDNGRILAPKVSGTEPLWLEAGHFVHSVYAGNVAPVGPTAARDSRGAGARGVSDCVPGDRSPSG
jgi:hypothetical protein